MHCASPNPDFFGDGAKEVNAVAEPAGATHPMLRWQVEH